MHKDLTPKFRRVFHLCVEGMTGQSPANLAEVCTSTQIMKSICTSGHLTFEWYTICVPMWNAAELWMQPVERDICPFDLVFHRTRLRPEPRAVSPRTRDIIQRRQRLDRHGLDRVSSWLPWLPDLQF